MKNNFIIKRLKHKLEHLSNIKDLLKTHGIPILIITIIWEVIEDIIFPYIFYFLGKNVSAVFYTMIPTSILLCSHWFVVPFIYGIYLNVNKNKRC